MSSETFNALDRYTWKLTYRWATFSHSNKPTRWVIAWYFGQFNKARHNRWVFGDRTSGAYLHKFAWTRIVRHETVKGAASPDDPALTEYWAERRRKTPPPTIGKTRRSLYEAQDGRCPLCGDWLLPAEDPPQNPREWEQWLTTTRKTIVMVATREDGAPDEPRLVHAHCHHQHATSEARDQHFCPPASLQGLLEPDTRKPARPILRGAGRSNAPGLPARAGASGLPSHTLARTAEAEASRHSITLPAPWILLSERIH